MTSLPPPAPANFDEAASVFDSRKPLGTRIAGLAIIIGSQILWSVNYEVDDNRFPEPTGGNRDKARAKFQSAQPNNAAVVQCNVVQIKPGGLVLSKWQVTYAVKMQAAAQPPKTKTKKDRPKPEQHQTSPTMQEFFDKTQNWLQQEAKKNQQLIERLRDVFITPKTVNRVTSYEARKWMSKSKSNVVHALKRIMAKNRKIPETATHPKDIKAKATTIQFVKAETLKPDVAKRPSQQSPIDPSQIYSGIKRMTLMRKIKEAKHDKLALCAAILHVASCNSPTQYNKRNCVSAAYWLCTYDISKDEIPITWKEATTLCRDVGIRPEQIIGLSISPRLESTEQAKLNSTKLSFCC